MVDMADVLVALEMQRMQQQAAMLAATPPGSRSSFGSLSSWASSGSLAAARASVDAGPLPPPPPYEFQHRKVCMRVYTPQFMHHLVCILVCTNQQSLCSCLWRVRSNNHVFWRKLFVASRMALTYACLPFYNSQPCRWIRLRPDTTLRLHHHLGLAAAAPHPSACGWLNRGCNL